MKLTLEVSVFLFTVRGPGRMLSFRPDSSLLGGCCCSPCVTEEEPEVEEVERLAPLFYRGGLHDSGCTLLVPLPGFLTLSASTTCRSLSLLGGGFPQVPP